MRMMPILGYAAAAILLSASAAWLWSAMTPNAQRDTAVPETGGDTAISRTAEPRTTTAETDVVSKTGTRAAMLPIPDRFQFGGVSSIPEASSRDELMERYLPHDQERIGAYYRSFGAGMDIGSKYNARDIFWFSNTRQLEWLLQSGFPTPDEILQADRMRDEELEEQATRGNFKAAAFLLTRISEQGESFSARHVLLEERILREASPFGAYVLAKKARASGKIEEALAAYTYADILGDDRSRQFSRIPGYDDASALMALTSLQTLLVQSTRQDPQSANFAVLAQQRRMPPP